MVARLFRIYELKMKKAYLYKIIATALLAFVSITVNAMKHNYGYRGDIIIYVGEQTTVSHPFPNYPYVDDDGWYLRATTGASWSEGKEKGGAKIISDNGFSCTIRGMWDNTGDDNFSLTLYCYGTRQSQNEEYECYWNVIVKSRGAITLSASPSGGTVTKGANVYLSSNVSGARIFYTTDGSIPTYDVITNQPLASTVSYSSSGITIDKSCVIKAIAHKDGYEDSEITTWEYKIPDENGDIFEANTVEGIKMQFQVIDSEQKTCQVFGGRYTDKDGNNHLTYAVTPATTKGPVTIPSIAGGFTVIAIRSEAFSECYRITSISIPSTVIAIYRNAFKGCEALEEITGGENVLDISMSSFGDCKWFTNKSDGLLYFGKTLLGWKGTMPDNTRISNIKNGIQRIASEAFYYQKGLISIDIPSSVKEIGSSAFSDTNISTINIPSNVKSIGSYAFSGTKLNTISIPDNVESIGAYALCKCENLESLYIGKNVKTLGGMQYGMKSLKSITVSPDNTCFDSRDNCNAVIETASNTLILGCSSTIIPETVFEIGDNAFYGNGSNTLERITIPNQVTKISRWSFAELDNLQSLIFGDGIKEIGIAAFLKCSSLKEIRVNMREPAQLGVNAFSPIYDEAIVYVPFNTKSKYESAEEWNKFKNILEMDEEISFTKGDVNMDNAVNGTDLVALSNIVLGRKEKTESADVNGDGSVNGTDIVALSNIILGRGSHAPRRAGEAGTGLSIEPFDIQAGEEKEMLIDLSNPNDELTLVQFDLHLPEGLSIKKSGADLDIDMGNRASWRKHTLDANETDGGYRFLLYSSSNTVIDGTSGAVIKVKVIADTSFKGGKIVIDNTLLVSPDEKETKPEAYEYTFPTTDDGSAKLAIEPFDIKAGEEKEMLIDLSNPNDEVTLVQFDLQLPEGLTVKKSGADLVYDMADRTSWRKHTLDANETDGGYRFLLYSSSNTVIDGTEGTIIKVTLTASQDMTGKTIALDNILLVSPDEKETKPARYEYVIGSDTGIRAITIDNDANAPIYNLRGQRLSAPQKGINIIGGKKVVVK